MALNLNELLQKNNAKKNDLISVGESLVTTTTRKLGTIKMLKQPIRNLREFKYASKRELHLDSIDLDFYNEFLNFLLNKNYGKNSIGGFTKNVKVFMNKAVERKLTTNRQYKNKRFKNVEEPSESIYLSKSEIHKIYNLSVSDNSKLEKIRDLFIIACYTGSRFSDLVQLRNENLNSEGTIIKIKTQETGEIVVIPLKSYIKEILQKYDGVPPKGVSNLFMSMPNMILFCLLIFLE